MANAPLVVSIVFVREVERNLRRMICSLLFMGHLNK